MPHAAVGAPSGAKVCTRLLAVSATATPPAGSSATAASARVKPKSPTSVPNWPHVRWKASVAKSKACTRWLLLSAT